MISGSVAPAYISGWSLLSFQSVAPAMLTVGPSSGDAAVLVSAQTAYKEGHILRGQEVGSTIQSPLDAEGRPYSLYS